MALHKWVVLAYVVSVLRQEVGDVNSWAFTGVISLRFVGHPDDNDFRSSKIGNDASQLGSNSLRHGIIDATRRRNQFRMRRIYLGQKPRIDRDTMPPHSYPWAQDIHPWMRICY